MAQIVWSDQAWEEYRLYLQQSKEEFGYQTARRFFESVSEKTKSLEKFPTIGFKEPILAERPENFRSCIIQKRFKLIYHHVEQTDIVYIDDIWDMKRNPKTLATRL